ncbi:MAG: C25 family cysteine peptidase [Thermoplasmatota archaeon]
MKKISMTIVIVSFFLLNGIGMSTSFVDDVYETIEQEVYFSKPSYTDQGDFIRISYEEKTSMVAQPGNPSLPIISKVFMIPCGSSVQDVSVSFDDGQQILLQKDITPASSPQYISTEFNGAVYASTINNDVYESTHPFPTDKFWYRTGAGLHGEDHIIYVTLFLSPLTYEPLNNIVTEHMKASISISYIPAETPVVFNDTFDLLIISPQGYIDALQPLVDAKETRGIRTILTALEDIPSVGIDQQEDMKYYIKDALENWGITYVLLVGGGIESYEQIPVRNAWVDSGNYERYFPSDLYYADIYDANMNFSTWDNNSNGKYAEFPADNASVDLYPDVYLGRIPCNTTQDVNNVVSKIISFMETNQMTYRIVQMGGDTFPDDPQKINEGEYANGQVMERLSDYTSTQLWGSKMNLFRFNIIYNIFKGVDFVDFSGHGSYVSWATHPPQDDSKWIPQGLYYDGFVYINAQWLLNTKKLPVFVFNACSCSKFSEFEPCLSWAMIKQPNGGAIASFGASGIGYGSYGTSETERLFGWMEVNLFEGLANQKVLGLVWGTALTNYINSFILEDADYKTIYEMALFGDPSLAIDNA